MFCSSRPAGEGKEYGFQKGVGFWAGFQKSNGLAGIRMTGHSDYYPRFGFRPAREFGLHPDWDAAMVCPLQDDLSAFRGLHLPE